MLTMNRQMVRICLVASLVFLRRCLVFFSRPIWSRFPEAFSTFKSFREAFPLVSAHCFCSDSRGREISDTGNPAPCPAPLLMMMMMKFADVLVQAWSSCCPTCTTPPSLASVSLVRSPSRRFSRFFTEGCWVFVLLSADNSDVSSS